MEFIPRPEQAYCIQRALTTHKIALFLGMSMGKTAVTLETIRRLQCNPFTVPRVLIIAPKKVTEATWQNEAKKWDQFNHFTFQLLDGTPKQRENKLCKPAHIYIISRDLTQWIVGYYKNAWPFDMVVLDESSSFKSHSAKRFKELRKVLPHITRVIELTGTPAPKNYGDLWSQIYLLDNGERLGQTFTRFRELYHRATHQIRPGVMNWVMAPNAQTEIENRIADIVVSLKTEDYVKLPDVLHEIVPVVLDSKARKQYDSTERMAIHELMNNDGLLLTSEVAVRSKLLQLCNGGIYQSDGSWLEMNTCKLEALDELLEALLYEDRHCLLYYQFKFDIERIMSRYTGKYRIRQLKKKTDEDDWNAGKIDILLAHSASAAHGLNLQYGGSEIIWFGLPSDLEQYEQANMRLPRNGQVRPVTIWKLVVQDAKDEEIVKLLDEKADVQEGLRNNLRDKITAKREKSQ